MVKEIARNKNITYNKYGAPELEHGRFISISHSKNLIAIATSYQKVGLDIEQISDKPLKLSSKFIAKNVHEDLSKEKATLIWCAKEAIYKWHQKGNIDFIKDIKLSNFDSSPMLLLFPFKIPITTLLFSLWLLFIQVTDVPITRLKI